MVLFGNSMLSGISVLSSISVLLGNSMDRLVTGRFGPIPVRSPGRFGPIPFRSGCFGPF